MNFSEMMVVSSRRISSKIGSRNFGPLGAQTGNDKVLLQSHGSGVVEEVKMSRQSLYRKQLATAIHDNLDVSIVRELERDPYDEHAVAMRFISIDCWEYLRDKLRMENEDHFRKIDDAVVGTFDISGFSKASHVIDLAINEAEQDDMARKKDAISILSSQSIKRLPSGVSCSCHIRTI